MLGEKPALTLGIGQKNDDAPRQIGKDLQFIRVNGTLVGGMIGLFLFLCAQLMEWIAR